MSSNLATSGRPYLDARLEIITFQANHGRFQITRAERYRLAILHGLTEAAARHDAYGGDAPAHPLPGGLHGFSADELFARFNADGSSKGKGIELRGTLPRTAGTGLHP